MGEDVSDGTGDNAHAILWVSWVCIEVDAGHGVCLPARGLAIGEDCAVETLKEAVDEGLGCRGEYRMLCRIWSVDLVEIKNLLFWRGGGDGRSALGKWATRRFDLKLIVSASVYDCSLESLGDRVRILGRRRSNSYRYNNSDERERRLARGRQ